MELGVLYFNWQLSVCGKHCPRPRGCGRDTTKPLTSWSSRTRKRETQAHTQAAKGSIAKVLWQVPVAGVSETEHV